ncbi:MAG: hypothetical protein ACFFCV_20800 [Promethearchaeota archaeon]
MRKSCHRNKKILIFTVLIALILSNIFINNSLLNQSAFYVENNIEKDDEDDLALKNQGIIQEPHTTEWLKNPTFETPIDPWYNITEGDSTDVNATTEQDQANFEVIGDSGVYRIDDPLSKTYWINKSNPEFPVRPDSYGVDSRGCWITHTWDENVNQTRNTPSIHWERDINMPVNMSDYVITAAKLNVTFNATVTVSPRINGIDRNGDTGVIYYSVGDFATFYVRISDLPKTQEYQVAYNQTVNLGRDNPPTPTISDEMSNVPENVLINLLTAVLQTDNRNFTITMGIDLYCEDNEFGGDVDIWDLLIIKTFNLTISYEKRIDQFTSLSWNQIGNTLMGSNIDIENATLNFKYKIDQQNWTTSSPNSEIRVYINNRVHTETVKLSKAKDTFQDIKSGGFDVTSLILKEVNISVSIQVYLADTFTLNQTITVSIDNASLLISYTENIVEETTSYDLLLNSIDKTLEKSIEVTMGDAVNITFVYKNQTSSDFIQNATVQLIGLGSPKNLSEDDIIGQYNITVHTSKLNLSNNYLTLSASKKYYESKSILINIKVLERETDLQLYLDRNNETLDKSITMIYGNSGNITITYKDKESYPYVHINNANVSLIGLGDPQDLLDYGLDQYTIIIDTKDLGLGTTYLSVNAIKENYTSQSIRFKIEVLERSSYIDKIYLNKTESILIEIPWNENLNIAITYNDTLTDNFIDNALVQLIGTGISINFTENSPLNYSTDISTSKLKLGVNFLTISARKDNYSIATKIITISVLERETNLEIYINNSLYIPSQYYNTSVGDFLNITVFYRDFISDLLISSASVQMIETGTPEDLDEHPILHYYSIIVETELLGAGVKFLTITANKDNYTFSTELVTVLIDEKESSIELYINGTQYFDGETIEAEINDILNVTVKYLDNVTKTFLNNATIELFGKGSLDENPILEFYNITVNVFDLEKSLNRLSIGAQIENYQYALIEFFVQVVERESDGVLLLNTVNKTDDPYLEVPVRSLVNFTLRFFDGKTGNFIPGATIRLDGDLTAVLDENASLEQYYLIVNTTQLSIGINVFSILAERPNFQPFFIQNIYINIQRISTNITTVSGKNTISTSPGKSITLSIVLYDLDFGGMIKGATVTYRWQYEPGELTDPENDGIYEVVISDVPEGSFIITVYAYAGDHYAFEPYEIVLSVIRPKQDLLLFQGLLIGISIAAGILVSYLIVYMRVLRFPKPVRRVRKFRKSLKRKTAPNIKISSREKAFNSIYTTELSKTSSVLKLKPPIRKKKPTQETEAKIPVPIKEKTVPSE